MMEGLEALERAADILADVDEEDPLKGFCDRLARWIESAVSEFHTHSSPAQPLDPH